MGKEDDNYIDKRLEGADILFGECPECDLFDEPRHETYYFTELYFDEEIENEICCLN